MSGEASRPVAITPEWDEVAWQNTEGLWRYGAHADDVMSDEQLADEYYADELAYVLEERDERRQTQHIVERLAAENRPLDYYEKLPAYQPKRQIGEYVAENGFNVPLIRTLEEWQKAQRLGKAMLRSELIQDYDGLQGVLTSSVIDTPKQWRYPVENMLLRLVRSRRIAEGEYMKQAFWQRDSVSYYSQVAEMGLPPRYVLNSMDLYDPDLSHWRYVPGLNIKIFRDPNVDGRYHIGTQSNQPPSKSSIYVEPENYGDEIHGKYYKKSIAAGRLIEEYEAIRALPRFDQTNAPFMEFQLDRRGRLHFLQYYKTKHAVTPTAAFELPGDGDNFSYVRGATQPEGLTTRIYINPQTVSERIIGQGCYIDSSRGSIREVMLSRLCKVILASSVNLRGNHASTALLYSPDVSICTWQRGGSALTQLAESLWRRQDKTGTNAFIDAHVTSNGHAAVVNSDFVVQYEQT